ncbi:hypothetical protein SAMN05216410_1001 [Sanguibacter gelidistatuariae]|uniref:Lipoprotein n=1 Tax=Sanguibacter gelidistatuariae TaxID=1814289 RepID=A0A1G6HGJ4_9MICO|nr:hypothetical protein [Sanguibacter gelidistatuariae]SDB93238.1 hypothetical protein SAMN05216410_1001 [Sanguibacter gelidistatuariae]
MRGKQAAGASALVLAALMVAGCGSASAEPEPTGEATQADTTEEDTARDVAACKAVSDVMTIADNADIALSEGRMAAQEQRGWYDVATRVLDRIPSTGDDAVSQGVADLKETAPPLTPGTGAEPLGIGSDAWGNALATLAEPCLAVDAELTYHVFTGG